MSIDPAIRKSVLEQAAAAAALSVAYVGVAQGLFDALADGPASSGDASRRANVDAGYCAAWCEAAYAFGYLDERDELFALSERGRAFARATPGSMFAVPVGAILGAHMAERAAFHGRTGERPGERVLAERETILPLFGPMLESMFAPLFREIAEQLSVFAELDQRHGIAVDLGCGNGWYLRVLGQRYPGLRGIGLDGFEANVEQARRLASAAGLGERLVFRAGDLRHFPIDEPVDLIAMNRSLHHVWEAGRREVFETLRDHLRPGGAAVIWEPAWPRTRATLREPPFRMMALQNLAEYVQGNHFLHPDEIEQAFAEVGMSATTHMFRDGAEAIVVGRRS